jgi:hypothetical protein
MCSGHGGRQKCGMKVKAKCSYTQKYKSLIGLGRKNCDTHTQHTQESSILS